MSVAIEYTPTEFVTDGVETGFIFDWETIRANTYRAFFDYGGPGEYEIDPGTFQVTPNGSGPVFSGGQIVFDVPPEAGTITLFRVTPIRQNVDYAPFRYFSAETTHEFGFDNLTLIYQELDKGAAR